MRKLLDPVLAELVRNRLLSLREAREVNAHLCSAQAMQLLDPGLYRKAHQALWLLQWQPQEWGAPLQ